MFKCVLLLRTNFQSNCLSVSQFNHEIFSFVFLNTRLVSRLYFFVCFCWSVWVVLVFVIFFLFVSMFRYVKSESTRCRSTYHFQLHTYWLTDIKEISHKLTLAHMLPKHVCVCERMCGVYHQTLYGCSVCFVCCLFGASVLNQSSASCLACVRVCVCFCLSYTYIFIYLFYCCHYYFVCDSICVCVWCVCIRACFSFYFSFVCSTSDCKTYVFDRYAIQ